jgi:DNA-binding response OmpR family regulator
MLLPVGGMDVAREVRRHAALASVRLVPLTGWGQPEGRARTAEAGFDRHLTKPTDPRVLTELLREFASARRAHLP